MKDIRFQILEELARIGHTTEQAEMNPFLSKIRTYNNNEDLGTIVEALKEIIRAGYVKEARDYGVIDSISTKGHPDTWKNPKRFIKDVGDAPKIKNIYLFLTLEGKKFLIEWKKLENDSWLSKVQRRSYYPLLFLTLVMSFITINKSCNLNSTESSKSLSRTYRTEEVDERHERRSLEKLNASSKQTYTEQ